MKGSINVGIQACSECNKHNKAMEIYNHIQWREDEHNLFMKFDKEAGEILINEDLLMHFIKMANPTQQVRKLRLVSLSDFLGRDVK